MPTINRLPDVKQWLGSKSHFLFGPRQTGKRFLIYLVLPEVRTYDLLDFGRRFCAIRNRR